MDRTLDVIDPTKGKLLSLVMEFGYTTVELGEPSDYGITSETLELIEWPPFYNDLTELEMDDDGEVGYPENV